MRGTLRPAFHINAAKQRKAVGYIVARCLFLDLFSMTQNNYGQGGSTMLLHKNTKNANFLFVVDMQ